ncbi:MAG: hypothetical protein EXR86_13010 [Gammaproteobacteria bacterium]|nr:hypothetical protein [Gammaproteobacteria bacterium]
MRRSALVAAVGALLVLAGCGDREPVLVGRPDGPYRLTLSIEPPAPLPAVPATLTYRLTDTASSQPIRDLQVLHERRIHTFIVARDFSSFAHIHHEDFAPILPTELAAGTLHFPYAFPSAGDYRIVSEFTRRDRSWIKQFDLTVGTAAPVRAKSELRLEAKDGPYLGILAMSPAQPVAGYDAELVLKVTRDATAVRDLALLLGAEVHVALWREDGGQFGHTHSFTPEMAMMMRHGQHSAAMMLQMMSAPAKLRYPGPQVPVRYRFSTPGTYHVFMQCAPGGGPRVFHFAFEVLADVPGVDTTLHSIVPFE